jgi:hypothetical protein
MITCDARWAGLLSLVVRRERRLVPYPRPFFILAVVGALGMWVFVLAHLLLAVIGLRTLCSKSCVRAWNDILRRLGLPLANGKKSEELAAHFMSTLFVVGGLDFGFRGVIYMVETSYYLYTLF